jgi:glutaredoxin-like YruB-family protein
MPEKKVVIFTQPGCPPCKTAKAYLTEKGIAFEDRDVSSDPAAVQDLVHRYGSRSTPTIVIGDEVMIGFDPERLDKLLGS